MYDKRLGSKGPLFNEEYKDVQGEYFALQKKWVLVDDLYCKKCKSRHISKYVKLKKSLDELKEDETVEFVIHYVCDICKTKQLKEG